jgi:hypothetical protein
MDLAQRANEFKRSLAISEQHTGSLSFFSSEFYVLFSL